VKKIQLNTSIAILFVFLLSLLCPVLAQQTTGNVRGIVKDPTGAIVPNAKISITDRQTSNTVTAESSGDGEFRFNNLLAGDYQITIEAANFKKLTLSDVRVVLNQTTDVPVTLQVGIQTETVEISAEGAELIQTTTTNLSKGFNSRQVVELPQTSITTANSASSGIYNLALLSANVTGSGGLGLGTGGSVGGQRPRNNNFVVDGIDNNRKDISGPAVYVSPETVSEFSILTNQFSAEFARSTGGQFIVASKSGGNEFHGTAYLFHRNRFLNALDTAQKNGGIVRERNVPGTTFMPRYDFNRYGGNLGGPLHLPRFGTGGSPIISGKDRLFFFASYEALGIGNAAAPAGLTAPTAAGFTALDRVAGLSAPNLALFKQYVPVAPTNDAGTIAVNGVSIPVGNISFDAPNWTNQRNVVVNIDYNQSDKTQHRGRFTYNRLRAIDNLATLPAFYFLGPTDGRLFSYTFLHTFTPKLTYEMRTSYRRFVNDVPIPDIKFPLAGFDAFPNIGLRDLGIDIGPNPNGPQFNTENNYQLINNLSYLAGNHSLKFGADVRKSISPQTFVQRERGDYQYDSTDRFLRDLNPDFLAERNVGASKYYGDQILLFSFAQDEWRMRPNLTLNAGVNYVYQQVPFGASLQKLNAISNVPGLIEFGAPKAQKKNFGPRLGLAYSPNYDSGFLGFLFGSGGKSSIRAGFSIAYDVIVDNLYILSSPPQAQVTVNIPATPVTTGFLANGGIRNVVPATSTSAAAARAATSAWVDDQQVPYAMSYSLSIQRQFLTNWSVEMRYLGTRGVHLPTQNRLNVQPKTTDTIFLPTYLSKPSQADLDRLTVTLEDTINPRSRFVPAYANAGFNGANVVAFVSNGSSTYHAFSSQLTRRFTGGFLANAAYTWSHNIDDSTAEVFSTVLSPRRAQDFQNMRAEKANSILDHRHRLAISGIYDLPFFAKSGNRFVRSVFGGFSFAGTYSYESGEHVTVLSGIDSNLNGDAAGDRSIINPNGVKGTSSLVTALTNTAGKTVGYLATVPQAQYIQAGLGARATAGRNTLQMPAINNLDFSLSKDFALTEGTKLQFRADFINGLNHPQYVTGSPNSVVPIATQAVGNINTVGRSQFNQPDLIFSSNPRLIQLALRLKF
jgi:Carboxypeptidase regulatory-like domain